MYMKLWEWVKNIKCEPLPCASSKGATQRESVVVRDSVTKTRCSYVFYTLDDLINQLIEVAIAGKFPKEKNNIDKKFQTVVLHEKQ